MISCTLFTAKFELVQVGLTDKIRLFMIIPPKREKDENSGAYIAPKYNKLSLRTWRNQNDIIFQFLNCLVS